MGNDEGSLREGKFEHRVERGRHGTIVQTGPVDEVNITPAERRSQILPILLASVAILVLLIAGAAVVAASLGMWPANSRQAHGNYGQTSPSPSPSQSAGTGTPSAPVSSQAPDEPRADEKQPHSDEEGPPSDSPPPGDEDSGASTGPGREFPYSKVTRLGEEITGAQATACGESELCVYRTRDHRQRYDIAAPLSGEVDTCYSLPSGDPGFASVVNGRGYSYYLYEKPGCDGDVHLVSTYKSPQEWDDFMFRSYAKA